MNGLFLTLGTLIWLSNVVHAHGPDDIQVLLEKAYYALRSGGRLILRDFILDPGKTSPPFGTIFAITMLLTTDQGNCYSLDEYRHWLGKAGFEDILQVNVTGAGNTSLIEARRGRDA